MSRWLEKKIERRGAYLFYSNLMLAWYIFIHIFKLNFNVKSFFFFFLKNILQSNNNNKKSIFKRNEILLQSKHTHTHLETHTHENPLEISGMSEK